MIYWQQLPNLNFFNDKVHSIKLLKNTKEEILLLLLNWKREITQNMEKIKNKIFKRSCNSLMIFIKTWDLNLNLISNPVSQAIL